MRPGAIFLMLLAPASLAAKHTDTDLHSFKAGAEVCTHLAGEWDVDLPDENKVEIKRGMNESCGRAKAL